MTGQWTEPLVPVELSETEKQERENVIDVLTQVADRIRAGHFDGVTIAWKVGDATMQVSPVLRKPIEHITIPGKLVT